MTVEIDQRYLLKVCHQFYRRGLTQTQIAVNLGISRFQVARLIEAAVDEGVVAVKILEAESLHPELELELEERFELRAALVVDSGGLDVEEARLRVADAAGRYLVEVLHDGDVLGVSLGTTVQAVVDQLPDRIPKRVEVVQLIGGSVALRSEMSSTVLTTQIADKLRSRSHILHAPAVVSTRELRTALLADPKIRATYAMFKQVTVSVLGIGALGAGTTSRLLYGDIIDEHVRRRLLADGAVGDVLAYIFGIDGQLIESGLEDLLIGMPLEDHTRVPHRIGVAAGEAKAGAIEGALRGRFINAIVTDSQTAHAILARPTAGVRPRASSGRRATKPRHLGWDRSAVLAPALAPARAEAGTLIDLTMPIVDGMPSNPDHFPPRITRYAELDSRGWVASELVLDSHLGTHIDAPSHFLANGITLDRIPLEQLVGPVQVIRLPPLAAGEAVSVSQVPPIVRDRVLFATGWESQATQPDTYFRTFPYLSLEAARLLVESGVRLVGIDGPSVDYDGSVHKLLLGAGAVIVENLVNLGQLPDLCWTAILPLPIVNGDGSPARAIASV